MTFKQVLLKKLEPNNLTNRLGLVLWKLQKKKKKTKSKPTDAHANVSVSSESNDVMQRHVHGKLLLACHNQNLSALEFDGPCPVLSTE